MQSKEQVLRMQNRFGLKLLCLGRITGVKVGMGSLLKSGFCASCAYHQQVC